jgi:hypothetical protein
MIRLLRTLAAFAALLLQWTCQEVDSSQPVQGARAFADMFAVVDTLRLEESDTTLIVTPYVYPDGVDGYLVTDGRENQVRRYTTDGRLEWQFGRTGAGPGEFRDPRAAVRSPDGRILVGQFNGRFTILDDSGAVALRAFSTPFRRVEQVAMLKGGVALIAGVVGGNLEGARLHKWDMDRETLLNSFFLPFGNTSVPDAAIIGGFARFATRGDTIVATWSVADSLYVFSPAGEALATHPLRSQYFRVPRDEPPGSTADPAEQARWLASFDYLAGVWWPTPDLIVLRYFEMVPEEAMSRRWHLILLRPQSGETIDIRNTPRLLAVDSTSGRFVFSDPSSLEPNRWLIAELRE